MQILVEFSEAMVNIEILEGIRAGLERGQSLKSAMMSFFNAGYNRTEIEETERAASQKPKPEGMKPQAPISHPIKKTFFGKQKAQSELKAPEMQVLKVQVPLSVPKQPFQQKPVAPVVTQNVSNYEDSSKQKSDKLIIIILVSVLVFLLGILATVFFFKDEIMSLFGGG